MIYYTASLVIGLGVLFSLSGCLALLRYPDTHTRLQGASRGVTLGTCFILSGVILLSGGVSGLKAALALFIIFLTAPAGAGAIARGALTFFSESGEDTDISQAQEDHGSRELPGKEDS